MSALGPEARCVPGVLANVGLGPEFTMSGDTAKLLSAARCHALRHLLMLTQAEAAQWLSSPPVSERAWQYWESGRRALPEDVESALRAASRQREQMLHEARLSAQAAPGLRIGVWYPKADDWKWTLQPAGLHWKMHNSVVAQLCSEGLVVLVSFDSQAYAAWSACRPTALSRDEILRHRQWAVSTVGLSSEARHG